MELPSMRPTDIRVRGEYDSRREASGFATTRVSYFVPEDFRYPVDSFIGQGLIFMRAAEEPFVIAGFLNPEIGAKIYDADPSLEEPRREVHGRAVREAGEGHIHLAGLSIPICFCIRYRKTLEVREHLVIFLPANFSDVSHSRLTPGWPKQKPQQLRTGVSCSSENAAFMPISTCPTCN
jgi:hypothetical protein